MPLSVIFCDAGVAGSYSVRIRQLYGSRFFFDFGALAFSASPGTPSHALTATSGAIAGALEYFLALTPVSTWIDGQYAAYIDNGSNTVDIAGFIMINGDSIPLSLALITSSIFGATASSFNTGGTMGAKINAAGSAGDPLANPTTTYSAGGTVGNLIVTNLNESITAAASAVTLAAGQVPAHFTALAIDLASGGVTVKTNNDKSNYVLAAGQVPGNFTSLQIDASTGGVTVKTNNDKTGYALSAGEHNQIAVDVLDAPALTHDINLTIGAKINLSGSAVDPLANAPSVYAAPGTVGHQLVTNLDEMISAAAASATLAAGQVPANFTALAIDSGTGGVTVHANSDKTGYALTTSEHTAIAGDVLNAPAASYDTNLTIGAKINLSGSAVDPLANALSVYANPGTVGNLIVTNIDEKITHAGDSVTLAPGQVPAFFTSLAINQQTGGVNVFENLDKSGYALTSAEHLAVSSDILNAVASTYDVPFSIGAKINALAVLAPGQLPTNFSAMAIDASTGGVTVHTNQDKTNYTILGSSGTGGISINHNTPTTDNLRAVNTAGVGIPNVQIFAFLASDYQAGNIGSAFLQATAVTGPDGRWLNTMMLAPQTYTFLFGDPGEFQTGAKTLTIT